jgi:hypothetical protein
MEKNAVIRTAIAAGVAGVGLSVGGIALASADDGSSDDTTRTDHRGGPGMRHEMVADDLAEALGVSEDKVSDALEAIHDDVRPERPADGTRPEMPTDAEREAMKAKFAAALAKELGISEAKVTEALEKLRTEREADARTALAERLDTAVSDGELTPADKASVLKAFDAGVLGGPGGFGGHGPR